MWAYTYQILNYVHGKQGKLNRRLVAASLNALLLDKIGDPLILFRDWFLAVRYFELLT